MAKIQDIDIPYLEFAEAAAPGTPASGIVRAYAKADGLMYSKDDAGTETAMAAGAAGAPTTADYLVGTANGGLSAEIVVGTLAGSYTAWTPTLTGSSSNPTLGSGGSATGRYTALGKHVSGYGTIQFGSSGAAAGSGEYLIALPVTATATTPRTMGSAVLYDASTGTFQTAVMYYSSTTVVRIAYTGTALTVSNSTPWTWAADDAIIFNLDYEAA